MKIFAMKPGHDGSIALVDAAAASLQWSFEAEKDSFPRYEVFNPEQLLLAAEQVDALPDVFAVSGWGKGSLAASAPIGAGYYGHDLSAVGGLDHAVGELRGLLRPPPVGGGTPRGPAVRPRRHLVQQQP